MEKTEFKVECAAYCTPLLKTIGIKSFAICDVSLKKVEHEGVEDDGNYDW